MAVARRPTLVVDDLPDDCLVRILCQLEVGDRLAAAQVCRRWRTSAADPSCWVDVICQVLDAPQAVLPAALGRMHHLQELHLHDYKGGRDFLSLDCVGALLSLRTLTVSWEWVECADNNPHCAEVMLPDNMGKRMPLLTRLELAFANVGNIKALAALPRLQALAIECCEMEAIPEDVLALTGLKELALSRNLIAEVPAGISSLVNLELLDISCTMFVPSLPGDSITTLKALKSLHLASCPDESTNVLLLYIPPAVEPVYVSLTYESTRAGAPLSDWAFGMQQGMDEGMDVTQLAPYADVMQWLAQRLVAGSAVSVGMDDE